MSDNIIPINQIRKCSNKHGITIYAAAQRDFSVRLFMHRGEKFKPLSMIRATEKEFYDQNVVEDVIAYTVEIDKAYEEFYLRNKDKDV